MTMLVLILDSGSSRASIGATTAERLAELGVTRITVARDTTTEAVVLEGWAFDAQDSGAEAARLVAGPDPARPLQPVLQTTLHVSDEGARKPRGGGDGAKDPPPDPPLQADRSVGRQRQPHQHPAESR